MKPLAGAIFSYNRPHYLKEVIQSLAKNTVQPNWYFFQDESKEAEKCVEIFKTHLKGEIVLAKKRKHIHQQKLESHELFEEYEKIIFFEDDLIVSPYYVHVLLSLSERLPENIVQASEAYRHGQKQIENFDRKTVVPTTSHWWGYLMGRNISEPFTKNLKEYVDFVGPNYTNRAHTKIREKYNTDVTSHDRNLDITCRITGIQKYGVYPRARYIGAEGMHARTKWFKSENYHIFKEYIFEEDAVIKPEDWKVL